MTHAKPSASGSGAVNLLPRIGQGSLSEQTTRALLEAILDRRFAGERLPNEPDLALQLGVSRTTIRTALQTLERLGVISRTPGRGTILRPHIGRDCMMFHRLIGFKGMLEAHYGEVGVEQKFTLTADPSAPARAALNTPAGTRTVLNDKVYVVEGKVAVHLLQEVPLEYVSDELAATLLSDGSFTAPETIFTFSEFWPGRQIDHTLVQLIPKVAIAREKRRLAIKVGTAYIALHETHYSEDNLPVAFSRESVHPDLVQLRLVRTR